MYHPPSLEYDCEADVLYINFGSDEISITEEVDDDMSIDRGYHSGIVTGMRIISPLAKGIIFASPLRPRFTRVDLPGYQWLSTLVQRCLHK